nr:MAG TPA: hypothetical protein [Caudoviricetes sp.]
MENSNVISHPIPPSRRLPQRNAGAASCLLIPVQ